MFCRRSHWSEHMPVIERAAAECDRFVFNGDTFDFKWSELKTEEATVQAAIGFLRDFARRHPDTQIHVNLGNHDHHYQFMRALDTLCEHTGNLSWHPYYLRVGNAVFLHGDVAMRRMTQPQLERYRSRWLHERRQGGLKRKVYDALFNARAHVAVSHVAFPGRLTVRRVHDYLDEIGHGPASGVEQVYFGHTHVPVRGRQYQGVRYHNGGAPMRHMDFTVLRANV